MKDKDLKSEIRSYISRDELVDFIDKKIETNNSYLNWVSKLDFPWEWGISETENRIIVSGYIGYLVIKDYLENPNKSEELLEKYVQLLLDMYTTEVKLLYENFLVSKGIDHEEDLVVCLAILQWGFTSVINDIESGVDTHTITFTLNDVCYDIYRNTFDLNQNPNVDPFDPDIENYFPYIRESYSGDNVEYFDMYGHYYGYALGFIVKIITNVLMYFEDPNLGVENITKLNSLYELKGDYFDE